ncbi:trichohyalin-like [Puntigrus tetrazona]|uniref:trichohyalin-like n=1 Tax=Puntigrus tetrazona TaxID=1606681 RepID=UPI001C8A1F3D|nr:trichohyalin-like [Puntigrus tetrazona]
MTDNHSHKEEKADRSAINKLSGMKNEVEKSNPGNSSLDQLEIEIGKLSIKDSSDRKDIRVKFLINVPVGVTSEMSTKAESHCQKFLDLLKSQAFREEDGFRYEDIAVVFGLNGKYEDEEIVKTELRKTVESEIAFKKWGFKWPERKEIPYRLIREKNKQSEHTKELVRIFRENYPGVPIYFCFFDADPVDFNEVLSSYIDVIIEHNYPTLMSTGFLFPEESEFRTNSEKDRQVRIITAEHFPLGTYYPEPNFCVLLPEGCDTLPERFTNTKSKHMNMESPVLIRQVKRRQGFSAVFANKNAIITPDSRQKHSHTKRWTWAISAYAHEELNVTKAYKQKQFGEEYENNKRKSNGVQKSLLMDLLKSDEEARRIEEKKPFEGNGAGLVFTAAKAVRGYAKTEQEEPGEHEDPEKLGEQEDPEELEQPEEQKYPEELEQSEDPEELEQPEEQKDPEQPEEQKDPGQLEEQKDPEELEQPEEQKYPEELEQSEDPEELEQPEEQKYPEELEEQKDPDELEQPKEQKDPEELEQLEEQKDPEELEEQKDPEELEQPEERSEQEMLKELKQLEELIEIEV